MRKEQRRLYTCPLAGDAASKAIARAGVKRTRSKCFRLPERAHNANYHDADAFSDTECEDEQATDFGDSILMELIGGSLAGTLASLLPVDKLGNIQVRGTLGVVKMEKLQ
jgi:hypothetical protein